MIRDLELRLPPARLAEPGALLHDAARAAGLSPTRIRHLAVLRRSLDARPRQAVFQLKVRVWVDEDPAPEAPFELGLGDVSRARPVVVVGAGPAGLFAALRLIAGGLRPVVLERGKPVRARRVDVARLCREGVVHPDSNYCFGEGGAGTFSDGKLYTRSTKRGEVGRILSILHAHGAPGEILVDAHPHIGTNRLPRVVEALRDTIVAHGGEVHFEMRVEGLRRAGSRVTGVRTAGGAGFDADAVILATGHSARDIYAMLLREGVAIEAKPFAVGVRVEHPQALIDRIQYSSPTRPDGLPPAAYSALRRVGARGVYSFCMCPGGVICPAATAPGEVVVNGWSPSKRNSRWANSGVVVEVSPADFAAAGSGPLAGIAFQSMLETRAAEAGGGRSVAPAQRLVDFIDGKRSADLPDCSYAPGLAEAPLAEVFPPAVALALREGLRGFEAVMRGYGTNEAVAVGVETRTSAPVRVPRDPATCRHPGAEGLFPCGEGAGAAGGIVSAAMDGERVAAAVLECIRP
jgi:uncharacterized FAD-dependent dehydrogenase